MSYYFIFIFFAHICRYVIIVIIIILRVCRAYTTQKRDQKSIERWHKLHIGLALFVHNIHLYQYAGETDICYYDDGARSEREGIV